MVKDSPGRGMQHASREINPNLADLPMLTCSFLSGLVDAASFNAAAVFVSMQTGNTVFIALGAASLPAGDAKRWLRALVSVASFLTGCSFFASMSRLLGPLRRSTLFASFFLQTLLLVVCASLAQTNVAPAFGIANVDPFAPVDLEEKQARDNQWAVYLTVAVLAFQSSGQIVLSRALGLGEIPSVVLTSLYCDLVSDPNVLQSSNTKRNRRLLSVVLFMIGGIASGWLQRTVVGVRGVLWIAAGVKLVIAFGWLVWEGKAKDGADP
ncbi:Protein of unknown function (DUF1275) [Emericellopsis cladophorae]|uniref:DUF1275 domain protein n=1 Tax=Emericellopsis cladophorae TaxID=2686198 RepID=A0A9P9XYS8_9HYPO|nr:Protein of unknown function (DUF1275) [Emericellopsis cladophorae]KAI6779955.1 Protein of unknown function (DUF1275) [Emericellopsis cladophorae]